MRCLLNFYYLGKGGIRPINIYKHLPKCTSRVGSDQVGSDRVDSDRVDSDRVDTRRVDACIPTNIPTLMDIHPLGTLLGALQLRLHLELAKAMDHLSRVGRRLLLSHLAFQKMLETSFPLLVEDSRRTGLKSVESLWVLALDLEFISPTSMATAKTTTYGSVTMAASRPTSTPEPFLAETPSASLLLALAHRAPLSDSQTSIATDLQTILSLTAMVRYLHGSTWGSPNSQPGMRTVLSLPILVLLSLR
jgi:hypothetical protein